MFEYKVLSERDTALSGNFDFNVLEETLNGFAAEGWRLAEGFLATSWKSGKSQMVMILERRIGATPEIP